MKSGNTDNPGHVRLFMILHNSALIILAGLLLLQAFDSLDWRMEHDTPLLHYAAYLINDVHLVPYRDIFETSMPGTFAFHCAVGKLFGYGDFAFRFVDLVLLSALLLATYRFMSRFGRLPALWAVILFGSIYLTRGEGVCLQRDYIGLIPVVFSLLCIPIRSDTAVRIYRFAIVGVLFGLSALIKPHSMIVLPAVFGTLLAFRWKFRYESMRDLLKCGAVCAMFLLIPATVAAMWLSYESALAPFLDILFNYLPLHSAMTGDHETISGVRRLFYLFNYTLAFGGYGPVLLASLFAYYRALKNVYQDRETLASLICLFLCTTLYAVYPTIAGKFWGYHYLPFAYFCAISAALLFYAWPRLPLSNLAASSREALPALVFFVALSLQVHLPHYAALAVKELRTGPEVHAPKNGVVDEMAGWLKSRLKPGDTVQPLDWTGGSIHAMLLAKARLATRFMYDYHFYHHISSPYIQALRESFIDQLHEASPRFIIDVQTDFPRVSGFDTTDEFPQLQQFLNDNYTVAHKGNGYVIYEHKEMIDS